MVESITIMTTAEDISRIGSKVDDEASRDSIGSLGKRGSSSFKSLKVRPLLIKCSLCTWRFKMTILILGLLSPKI